MSKIVSLFLAGLPSVLGWTRPVPFFPPANPHARLLAKMDNGHPNQSNAPLLPFKSGPRPDINPSYESPSTYCHGSETAAGRLLLSVQSPHCRRLFFTRCLGSRCQRRPPPQVSPHPPASPFSIRVLVLSFPLTISFRSWRRTSSTAESGL